MKICRRPGELCYDVCRAEEVRLEYNTPVEYGPIGKIVMIRFSCQHCGKAVCVSDAHAGAKGRCPHCQEIVAIPLSADSGSNDNVAALAAALQGDSGDSGVAPPPPQAHNNETDEFDLVDIHTSSAFETDTYPAIRDEQAEEKSDEQDGAKESTTTPTGQGRSWVGLIITVVVTAVVVAAVVLWLCRRFI